MQEVAINDLKAKLDIEKVWRWDSTSIPFVP